MARIETDLEALMEAEGYASRPGPRPKIDIDIIHELRYSVKSNLKVKIAYQPRWDGKKQNRTVSPYGFVYGNKHYLVAYCDDVGGIRNFLISGIEKIELTEEYFVKDGKFDIKNIQKIHLVRSKKNQ